MKLVGANHCDPEKNNDFLGCGLTCGSWNATRHQRYLRYVTGWFEYFLRCDRTYEEWVLGARVEQDLAAGLITYEAALAPEPPTGLAASADGAAIAVTRAAADRCAAIAFWRLFRGAASGGPYALRADELPAASTSFRDEAVEPGRTYFTSHATWPATSVRSPKARTRTRPRPPPAAAGPVRARPARRRRR